MAKAEQIGKAAELGAAAFAKGLIRVPALDSDFHTFLFGRNAKVKGDATVIELLNAWLRAWDEANINA